MPTLFSYGSPKSIITQQQKEAFVQEIIQHIFQHQGVLPQRVLLLPPDMTRIHSDAGNLTQLFYQWLAPQAHVDILPAIGTHFPMTEGEIRHMFGSAIPLDRFKVHDWRNDVIIQGDLPQEKIRELSDGALDYAMRVGINKLLFEGYDLILSIGQVVPHEVIGMANYTKNICVGIGGADLINKSHFLGAVYGMERIMGRIDTPVRRAINEAYHAFLGHLPIYFIMTVIQKQGDELLMRGLYCGNDDETFRMAASLSQQVNLDLLDHPIEKAVVYLDPAEFKSTWLGNKAIYRLRMVMADGGELIILAPGLKQFGEDAENDRLIRKYGYHGTAATLQAVEAYAELANNLSAAAHLIHGSSEGRFNITYCPGAQISRQDIEAVGFNYATYAEMQKRYNPAALHDGWNTLPDGETLFYVSNPALGLWALKKQFAS